MKKHWDTVIRILDKGRVHDALKTHNQMRHDFLPTLDYIQLCIAINKLIPKKYNRKDKSTDG